MTAPKTPPRRLEFMPNTRTKAKTLDASALYGTEKIGKVLFKLAPPVMLAQLIQALYNVVDSLFVGRYSDSGLTALSIIYPVQLLMIALAVGTGVGINTVMAAKLGTGHKEEADEYAGVGTPLAVVLWALFALSGYLLMPAYARMSTTSEAVIEDVIVYGRIACVFSFGLFLESVWTKVLQAVGNMKAPMFAQIAGAAVNIVLDPLLIFGVWVFPEMGIAGAAVATVLGQIVAALIVMKGGFRRSPALRLYPRHTLTIFRLGIPNILMQAAYTFYILGLNLILSGFSDQAVTALGLYYKWQTFFFIPLGAMQTCIVPVISFNYAAKDIRRCKQTLWASVLFGAVFMAVGLVVFETLPAQMLSVFTSDPEVIRIGTVGFRFTGASFLPLVTSLIFPAFFQAVGASLKSTLLTVVRTVICFVPLGYLFSRFGLTMFWMTYPVTEVVTTIVGLVCYKQFLGCDYVRSAGQPPLLEAGELALKPSKPGVIVTIARQHGSSGKQIGKMAAAKLGIPFYYKEMIALAAHESGLDRDFISNIHKNSPDVLRGLYLSSHAVRRAMLAQDKIIRKIAEEGSCVIVGRAADHVLRDFPNVVRVFIGAPEEFRISRVREVYGDTLQEAKRNLRHSDKARAGYYRHLSGKRWGDPQNYDLVLDSSEGLEAAAETLAAFVKEKERALFPQADTQQTTEAQTQQ